VRPKRVRVIVYPDRTDAYGRPVETFSALVESPDSTSAPLEEYEHAPDLAAAREWALARSPIVWLNRGGGFVWIGRGDPPKDEILRGPD